MAMISVPMNTPFIPQVEQKPEAQDDIETVEMETENSEEEAKDKSGVIKITNISPGANIDQMKILFGFLGTIAELVLYPMDENVPVTSKTCYVRFEDKASCDVAQHLTNTVFVDRPLVIVPIQDGVIPDEGTALQSRAPVTNGANGMGAMDDPFSDPFSQFMGTLSVGNNLPPPPVLGNIDPVKIEEIRRTVYVGNLDDIVGPEMLVAFFSGVGEIKYVRQSQNEEGKKYALIEFTDLSVVATALQYSGVIFCGMPMHVTYSKCAIIKPDFEKLEAERKNADRHSRYSSRRRSRSLEDEKRSANHADKRSRRRSSRSRSRSRRRSRRSRSRSYSRSRGGSSYSSSRRRRSRSGSYSRSRRRRSRSRSKSHRRRRSRSRSASRSADVSTKKVPVIRDRRRRRSYSRSRSPDSKYRSSSSRRSRRRTKSRSPSRSASVRKSKSRSPSRDRERRRKSRSSKSRSRTPSKSHSRHKSKKSHRSRSRSRSRDRRVRDKDRDGYKKRDRKSKERSASKDKKAEPLSKEGTPQYKDVDDIANNSDMSVEDENETKKKDKPRNGYDSDEKSSKK